MAKKFLFAITFISIATIISIAGYLFFVKQQPALAQTEIYSLPFERSIDWSKSGVSGGIPNRTVICATLNPSGGDDTSAIKAAISNCSVNQVVKLNDGVFNISSPISIKSGITLRGNGPSKTKLLFSGTTGYMDGIIRIVGNLVWTSSPFPCPSSGQFIDVSGSPVKGDTTIMVFNAAGLAAGDVIVISRTNDGVLVNPNYQQGCGACGMCGGTRAMTQMTEIQSINGNILTIDPPLAMPYDSAYSVKIAKITAVIYDAGVEDLYLENLGGTKSYSTFLIQYAKNCWLKNVETKNPWRRHAWIMGGLKNTIRDSYFHDSVGTNGPDEGYGVALHNMSSFNLIENNIFDNIHAAMSLDLGAGSGNVFGYNYSNNILYNDTTTLQPDIAVHSSFPHMNLFEGNYVHRIINDTIHGSNAYNVYFRNRVIREQGLLPTKTGMLQVTMLEAGSSNSSYLGNVLGYLGMSGQYELANQTCTYGVGDAGIYKIGYNMASDCNPTGNDSNVAGTLLRHGNYDYISQLVKWDENITNHNLPASYYLISKPAFFGSKQWPLFGGDLSPVIQGVLPAEDRFTMINNPSLPLKGDFNSDSKVNDLDFTSFKNAFKSIFNSIFDLNSDNTIDVKDLGVLMSGWLP